MGECTSEGGELDFKRLFEALPGNCLVVDRQFRMVAATDVRLRETKRDRKDVIGKNLFELFPDNPKDPEATGVRNLRRSLERVLRTKAPDTMPLQKYDIQRPAREGGGFEERYWSPVNAPVLDENGDVAYIIHRVEDVTDFVHLKEERVGPETKRADWQQRVERLEAEVFAHAQEVQRTNERLRTTQEATEAVLRSISDGFLSLDREWRFLYVNAREADLVGKPAEALIGKSLWEFFPEPGDGVLHRELGRAMNERVPVEFEYFDEHNCRWLEKRAYPSSQGISCLATDVTARKRAETRLAAEHAVTRILSAARSFEEAAKALLPALCGILDAQVAGLWLVDSGGQELHCAGLHRCDDSEEARRFTEESKRFRFLGGESLPGRVWAEGKALWIADFAQAKNFTRRHIALQAGLQSAVAFPIKTPNEFHGVIELFLKRMCEEDVTLAEITTALGSQIGQFIQRKRAEEAQQRSELRYRRLFEAAQDGVLILNLDNGAINDANPFIATLLGCSREELHGKKLWEVGLAADTEASLALVEELRRNGRSRYEISVPTRTAGARALEIVCNLYREDGEPVIQCTIRDQTERDAAEGMLVERARLLDLSSDAIIARDSKNRITFWNRGAEDLFGWTRDQALGQDLHTLLKTEFEAPYEKLVDQLFRENRLTGEIVQTTKDGRRLNLLCRWLVNRNERDEVSSILSTTTDITERKEAEEALRRSEARLARAVEVSNLGTFEHDHRTGVLEFSPVMRRLTEFEEGAELTFEAFLERVIVEDRGRLREMIARAHDPAGDGVFATEYRVKAADGSIRWIAVRSQTFFEGEGNARRQLRTIGAALDVTEQKEAQKRLEQLVAERTAQLLEANANLQHFAYTAAHDLRSPLRGISGFATLTLERYGDRLDPMGRTMVEQIVTSATQMGQLLSDLLEYSKVTQRELRLEKVSLEEAVREGLRLLEEDIREKKAEVNVTGVLPKVMAHPATLVMIVNNLVSNGLKFVSAGIKPRLRIWAETLPPREREDGQLDRSSAHRVRLWVEDNGIGIATEDQERVFEVFQRLHGKADYAGTGLGLAIVRRGAERMGGNAGVESEEGKGSRFWVELEAI